MTAESRGNIITRRKEIRPQVLLLLLVLLFVPPGLFALISLSFPELSVTDASAIFGGGKKKKKNTHVERAFRILRVRALSVLLLVRSSLD